MIWNELWMSLALQTLYSAWIMCAVLVCTCWWCDRTILLLSSPQSCTACWLLASPWGAFIGNHSTVKIANHRSLYALLWLMWLPGQRKQRSSEKPYSHTSDCLTLVFSDILVSVFFWFGRFNEGKGMTRLTGSHILVMLYCCVPTVGVRASC